MSFDPAKLLRLFQPSKGLFWLMVALNGASAVIFWVVQTRSGQLSDWLRVVLALAALGNAYFGLRCAQELMRDSPPTIDQA